MINYPSIITIEFRMPRTKDERGIYGETIVKRNQAKIFINSATNQNRKELLDTLMHECYHAIVGMYRFSTKREEYKARRIGKLARE